MKKIMTEKKIPMAATPLGKSKTVAVILLLLLLSIYSVTTYFNYSTELNGVPAFPLDDAWIFWGFATTFAGSGTMSLNPATPAGPGVTSPGYMVLLAGMISLGFDDVFLINLLLNSIFLFLSSFLMFRITHLISQNIVISMAIPLLFIFDFRTACIADSGMETLLFIFFQLLALHLLQIKRFPAALTVLGISVWVRPELLVLVPIAALFYRQEIKWRQYFFFFVPFSTYFVFLKIFTGHFWLNTGAAKFDFYSYVSRWDYLLRASKYIGFSAFPIVILMIAMGIFQWKRLKKEKIFLVMILYFVLFWAAFFLMLPVLYHFGRYIFPLIPLTYLWIAYIYNIIFKTASNRIIPTRIPSSAMQKFSGKWKSLLTKIRTPNVFRYAFYTLMLTILVFSFFRYHEGRHFFAHECNVFLQRHVKTALWIKNNLPEDTAVATHDIGAIGYLSGRPVIDIIGLMDHRAIGISTDENKMRDFLKENHCNYLAVLNSWFVVKNARLLHQFPSKGEIRFQVFQLTPNSRVIRLDQVSMTSSEVQNRQN